MPRRHLLLIFFPLLLASGLLLTLQNIWQVERNQGYLSIDLRQGVLVADGVAYNPRAVAVDAYLAAQSIEPLVATGWQRLRALSWLNSGIGPVFRSTLVQPLAAESELRQVLRRLLSRIRARMHC